MLVEGSFVSMIHDGETVYGRVEYVMNNEGTLGLEESEYSIQYDENDKPIIIRIHEMGSGWLEETPYLMYHKSSEVTLLTEMPMTQMVEKADSYKPTAGMVTAAKRALRWKEEGKANGAGTPVGWGRARDIVAGRSMSLSVVKRMYSFFSRHEVDKKGKDFYNTENPSNGRIMWDAWGGDAGYSWSRAIVNREKEKANKLWENSAFDIRKGL